MLVKTKINRKNLLVILLEKFFKPGGKNNNEYLIYALEVFNFDSLLATHFPYLFQCLDMEFDYGFEYIGSSPREVITPLTERAFLALTQAIKAHNGGLCMGPAVSIYKLCVIL